MSAFIVDPEHINVMIWAAAHKVNRHHGPLRWYYGNPTHAGQVSHDNVDQVGQMLLDENAASVNYRYTEDDVFVYEYRPPQHTNWSVVELLKAIDCYEYQACEHPDWAQSQAHAFCQALRLRLISALPGYDAASWRITPNTVPQRAATT